MSSLGGGLSSYVKLQNKVFPTLPTWVVPDTFSKKYSDNQAMSLASALFVNQEGFYYMGK